MTHIYDLHTQLLVNVAEIDTLLEEVIRIEENEFNDIDRLEKLYEKEFLLYMTNVALYEDLMNALDNEEKTINTEFTLAKIRKDASKLLKVEIMEIGE